jgi:NFACT protein C-terminal domain
LLANVAAPAPQGVPRDDDVILYALPVCAPYAVLAGYRYKAKLTPGSQKRGKAARQVPGHCVR